MYLLFPIPTPGRFFSSRAKPAGVASPAAQTQSTQ